MDQDFSVRQLKPDLNIDEIVSRANTGDPSQDFVRDIVLSIKATDGMHGRVLVQDGASLLEGKSIEFSAFSPYKSH